MFKPLNICTTAAVSYQTSILNADGSLARRRVFKKNLILDQGLDLVATTQWCDCFNYCAVGTGTDPTRRDSGAITFTRAGTTITASAGFFSAADVGRLLKWNTGEEVYISAYTSPTVVSSVSTGTIAAAIGTVWYVNQTALTTESTRTNSLSADGGANGTTFSVDTYTHQRTFLFAAVGANVTYNEIGWSPAPAGSLFGRDVIPGGDTLLVGQQYKVVVKLILKISPVAPAAQANVGNNGFNTAGQFNHEYIGNAYSIVNSGGATIAGSMDPAAAFNCGLLAGAFTLLAAVSYTSASLTPLYHLGMTNLTYTNGNFYRDAQCIFPVGSANSTDLRAVIFGVPYYGDIYRNFSVSFTTPQTKDSLHTVKITLRKSWGRTLVN